MRFENQELQELQYKQNKHSSLSHPWLSNLLLMKGIKLDSELATVLMYRSVNPISLAFNKMWTMLEEEKTFSYCRPSPFTVM